MSIIKLTHENFDNVITKHDLIFIIFTAKWCMPCKSFAQVIAQVAKQYPYVAFASVDIDVEKQLAEEFNILSIPAVMLMRERVIVFAESGIMTAGSLCELIQQAQTLDREKLAQVVAKNERE